MFIDHIVGNVRENEMNLWAEYFNKTMGFKTFVDFKAGDIGTKYSALLSKVVRSDDFTIRNTINEPFEGLKKSQIEEYIEQYHGSGVQHIAIATDDIISTIPPSESPFFLISLIFLSIFLAASKSGHCK